MSAYVNMVCDLLRNSLPKDVVHCQVRGAKQSLLDHFYAQVRKRELDTIFPVLLWFLVLKVVINSCGGFALTVNIVMFYLLEREACRYFRYDITVTLAKHTD